jgi:hypothetical protein
MLASRQAEQENANKKGDRAGYGNGGCERKPCHNSPLRKMIPRLKARFKLLLLSGFQALLVRRSRWNCDAGHNFVYLLLAGLYSSTMPKPLRAPRFEKRGGDFALSLQSFAGFPKGAGTSAGSSCVISAPKLSFPPRCAGTCGAFPGSRRGPPAAPPAS